MSGGLFIERVHSEIGIAAVADFAAGDVFSDVVNFKGYGRVVFLTHWGVGATGVVKLTVQACDDVVPTTTSAVPFHYRINNAGTTGAVTAATAADGVSNSAGSNQLIWIEAPVEALHASGYSFVRLSVDETTDSPLLGGVIVLLLDPVFTAGTNASALS